MRGLPSLQGRQRGQRWEARSSGPSPPPPACPLAGHAVAFPARVHCKPPAGVPQPRPGPSPCRRGALRGTSSQVGFGTEDVRHRVPPRGAGPASHSSEVLLALLVGGGAQWSPAPHSGSSMPPLRSRGPCSGRTVLVGSPTPGSLAWTAPPGRALGADSAAVRASLGGRGGPERGVGQGPPLPPQALVRQWGGGRQRTCWPRAPPPPPTQTQDGGSPASLPSRGRGPVSYPERRTPLCAPG